MAKENQMADLTAKQVAQGAMILAVKEPKDYYDVRDTSFRYTAEHYQAMDSIWLGLGARNSKVWLGPLTTMLQDSLTWQKK